MSTNCTANPTGCLPAYDGVLPCSTTLFQFLVPPLAECIANPIFSLAAAPFINRAHRYEFWIMSVTAGALINTCLFALVAAAVFRWETPTLPTSVAPPWGSLAMILLARPQANFVPMLLSLASDDWFTTVRIDAMLTDALLGFATLFGAGYYLRDPGMCAYGDWSCSENNQYGDDNGDTSLLVVALRTPAAVLWDIDAPAANMFRAALTAIMVVLTVPYFLLLLYIWWFRDGRMGKRETIAVAAVSVGAFACSWCIWVGYARLVLGSHTCPEGGTMGRVTAVLVVAPLGTILARHAIRRLYAWAPDRWTKDVFLNLVPHWAKRYMHPSASSQVPDHSSDQGYQDRNWLVLGIDQDKRHVEDHGHELGDRY